MFLLQRIRFSFNGDIYEEHVLERDLWTMDIVVSDSLAKNVKETFQQKAHFRLSLNNSEKKQKDERAVDGEGGGGGGED